MFFFPSQTCVLLLSPGVLTLLLSRDLTRLDIIVAWWLGIIIVVWWFDIINHRLVTWRCRRWLPCQDISAILVCVQPTVYLTKSFFFSICQTILFCLSTWVDNCRPWFSFFFAFNFPGMGSFLWLLSSHDMPQKIMFVSLLCWFMGCVCHNIFKNVPLWSSKLCSTSVSKTTSLVACSFILSITLPWMKLEGGREEKEDCW